MTRSPPYRDTLDEVVAEVFPDGRVTRSRRMRGGLGSLMHAVDVDVGGERLHLSLRRFHRPEWGHDAELARREFHVLKHLHAEGLAVAEPIWMDADGGRFGAPALLLRHVPGEPILDPPDVVSWAEGLAGALVAIHRVDVAPLVPHLAGGTREERILRHLADLESREAYEGPLADAPRLLDIVRDLLAAPTQRRLTHGDFHPGNVLWAGCEVSGVIDWAGVRLGDPRFDLAYLRLDTTLILGADAADALLAAYEDAVGSTVGEMAAWDVYAATMALPDPARWLPSYVEQGRTDLDERTVRDRLRGFIARAEQRS